MTAGVHLLNFPSDFGVSLFCSCDGSSSQESDRRRSRWAEGGDGEWIDLHHTGRYGHRFYASWACVVFSDVTCSCVVFQSCVSVVLLMAVSCFSYVSCSYIRMQNLIACIVAVDRFFFLSCDFARFIALGELLQGCFITIWLCRVLVQCEVAVLCISDGCIVY